MRDRHLDDRVSAHGLAVARGQLLAVLSSGSRFISCCARPCRPPRRVCPSLTSKRVSPHVIRHGTAMALLQAGVDIAVIGVWLGHESIETTNVYVHANLAMKEKALAKTQPMDTPFRRFRPDDHLLAFLESL
jgi:integrase/recombinase XerD